MKTNAAITALSLAILGCSGVRTVTVPYLFLTDATSQAQYSSLQNIYLQFPKDKHSATPMAATYFARRLQKSLSRFGAGIAAYHFVDDPANDKYLKEINPSAVLVVRLPLFTRTSNEHKQELRTKDANGKDKVETKTSWSYSISAIVSYQYKPWPEGSVREQKFPTMAEATNYTHPPDESEYDSLAAIALDKAADRVAAELLPSGAVMRSRPLLTLKDQREFNSKVSSVEQGDWKSGEEFWKARISSGSVGCEDLLNLAVSEEMARKYSEARKNYDLARATCAGRKDLANVPWDQINDDLEKSALRAASAADHFRSPWFSHRVAILPFSDETVSIDGPELVRHLIEQTLSEGGYQVLPIAESDEKLQAIGLSDGGQLKLFKLAELAKLLEVDWLIIGNISEFNEVNVGIYVSRTVAGDIKIWDAPSAKEIWSAQDKYSRSSTPTSGTKEGLIGHFVGNLLQTWVDHASKKPMFAEVKAWVGEIFGDFPLAP